MDFPHKYNRLKRKTTKTNHQDFFVSETTNTLQLFCNNRRHKCKSYPIRSRDRKKIRHYFSGHKCIGFKRTDLIEIFISPADLNIVHELPSINMRKDVIISDHKFNESVYYDRNSTLNRNSSYINMSASTLEKVIQC